MSREAYAQFQSEADEDKELYGNPKPGIRFMSKYMELFARCGDFREIKFNDKSNVPGSLTMTVPDNEVWEEYFYGQSQYAVRPIVVDLPGYQTVWFTTTFARVQDRRTRKKFIQIVAVSPLEFLNWVRIFPNAWFPPEFQWPKEWSGFAPAATLLSMALTPNLIRLQAPLWSIPSGDLLDPQTYNLFRNAMWPLMVNPRKKGLFDGTPWTAGVARMDKFMDFAQDVCKTENLEMTMTWFNPGEHPQPFPEFVTLTRPTMVVDFEPMGDPLAFEGNAVGGLIRTGIAMAKDAIEWITYPILNPNDPDPELEGIPVYRNGQHSTIDHGEEVTHIPLATRATVGGKSPDWLNQAIVTGANLLLGVISSAAGSVIPGFPVLQLGIFEDQVKDVVMAFHSQEDLRLAREAGPWRFREAFGESSVTGLSLNAYASMKTTLFDHRGYVSQSVEVSNGAPYYVGRDLKKGKPCGYETPSGKIRVEKLTEISYEYSRTVRGRFTLQIGSGEAEREPGQLALGKIRKIGSWLTRVALGA
ncbi:MULTISPECIES: hypothetical protein [unclassified Rhodococcus (in: high G+C Gram-positive bacteria)]|uniref:Gp37-like protein n=1 Tax=unclassified Rhodococcus (in: high G+C Gram-positive bacteria) TaxID=192944 RepID=UPI000B9C6536|nr:MULTISPECIES: hypothetical protein [unclassified Rhodococcus (in: high G+C Gram-positive bacteria)]OZE35599.1 hypothetical protein CH259_16350 [Rhodococcus sp. 05-2254-4]OZE48028.1 hypothetical protein CH261_08945 [Rhodococcus sp. 05-2254-3]OZE49239.1 hypothetical protein CH283_16730 [Rhodococcus sp. 05-2254-2]